MTSEPAPPGAHDLEQRVLAARLSGLHEETETALTAAHQAYLAAGDARGAARCAIWLGFELVTGGEVARAAGWLARARRLLDELPEPTPEHGLALVPAGIQALREGDLAGARARFREAAAVARRFGDADLLTLGLHGEGRTLVEAGDIAPGMALLDEAMVAVTAGEVTPIIAGAIYCSVIEVCAGVLDLDRARQWTAALDRWCAAHAEAIPFRGHCRLRHAELLQLDGAWGEARAEAERAADHFLAPRPRPAAAAAFLRLAELARLSGDFAAAEALYRRAGEADHAPHAGLALLRLGQERLPEARAIVERVLEEVRDPAGRARALEACVEIALAAGEPARARAAALELGALASRVGAPVLAGMARGAEAEVALAEGDARAALAGFRAAFQAWRGLAAPYEAARARVGLGLACRALGDADAAERELAAARRAFEELGALPDLARLGARREAAETAAAAGGARPGAVDAAATDAGPLTAREREVVTLVARGLTNRAIAERLFISEKTVARHLSNVFDKLDLGSRSALTAYAYEHGLVPR